MLHPVGEPRITHFLPVITVILAAVDADRPATGIDRPAVGRIDCDRPDVGLGVGQCQPLPAAAAIGAAKGPFCRTDKNHFGICRMDRDGVHRRPLRQPVRQRLPALISDPLAKDAAASSVGRPHRTRVHIGYLGNHALPSSVVTLPKILTQVTSLRKDEPHERADHRGGHRRTDPGFWLRKHGFAPTLVVETAPALRTRGYATISGVSARPASIPW